jgi:hypothetical protein
MIYYLQAPGSSRGPCHLSATDADIPFERLRKVVEALGYGRIVEIVLEDGAPVAVVAQVRISLKENVAARLRRLGPVLDN